eukprot:1940388-Amphidinium_carterae.1
MDSVICVMLVGNVNDFSEHTAATSQTLKTSYYFLVRPHFPTMAYVNPTAVPTAVPATAAATTTATPAVATPASAEDVTSSSSTPMSILDFNLAEAWRLLKLTLRRRSVSLLVIGHCATKVQVDGAGVASKRTQLRGLTEDQVPQGYQAVYLHSKISTLDARFPTRDLGDSTSACQASAKLSKINANEHQTVRANPCGGTPSTCRVMAVLSFNMGYWEQDVKLSAYAVLLDTKMHENDNLVNAMSSKVPTQFS